MAGYTLTSKGLQRTERAEVEAGQEVFFGASASPALVTVVAADDEWITVNKRGVEIREQRWIAEDLIARGNRTMIKRSQELHELAQVTDGAMGRLYAMQAQSIMESVRA